MSCSVYSVHFNEYASHRAYGVGAAAPGIQRNITKYLIYLSRFDASTAGLHVQRENHCKL
jgi:hypothetical protein